MDFRLVITYNLSADWLLLEPGDLLRLYLKRPCQVQRWKLLRKENWNCQWIIANWKDVTVGCRFLLFPSARQNKISVVPIPTTPTDRRPARERYNSTMSASNEFWLTTSAPEPITVLISWRGEMWPRDRRRPTIIMVRYKMAVLAYRSLHGTAPKYLASLLTSSSVVTGRQYLRSAAQQKLIVPRCRRKTFGSRAFSVASPSVWNALPDSLGDPELTLDIFRRHLKTYFFTLY